MTINKLESLTFATLLSTAVGTLNVQAQDNLDGAAAEGFRTEQPAFRDGFSVAPYFWAQIFNGTMTLNGQTVSLSGTNVFDLLSSGDLNFPPLVGVFEWQLDSGLGIYLDTTAIGLNFGASDISLGPGPLTAAFGVDFTYALVNAGLVIDSREWEGNNEFSNDLDYMVGLRYTYYDVDLSGAIGPVPVSLADTLSWTDATAGVRLRGKNADGAFYTLHGDIGLGEGTSAQAFALIGKNWKRGRTTDLNIFGGYRVLYQDWSDGDDAVDLTTHGPVVGLQWIF